MIDSMRLRPRFVWASMLLALYFGSPLAAETDPNLERGFAPDKVYAFGEIDQVNLFNGNLMLNLPVGGSYAVNGGFSYGLVLSYNSNVWDFESSCHEINGLLQCYTAAFPNRESNAGLGWSISLGKLFPEGTGGYDHWRYVGEDGGEHAFYSTLHIGEAATANVFYTRDGSYLRLRQVPGMSSLQYEVDFPDGTIKKFIRTSTSSPFRMAEIRDPFGNKLTVTLGQNQWILTDGHRSHTINFATRPNGTTVVSSVVVAAFGGVTATYELTYSDETIARSCADDEPDELDNGTPVTADVTFLRSLKLPDGSTYGFDATGAYNTTCFEGSTEVRNLPGTLKRLTLPTLGRLEWTYRTYAYPVRGQSGGQSGPNLSISNVAGVATKRVLNASGACETLGGVGCEWNYTPAGGVAGNGGPRTTTVRQPSGDESVHHFNQSIALSTSTGDGWQYGLPIHLTTTDGGGRFLSREVYDGTAATGVKKQSIYVRYEHDRLPSSTTNPALWYNTNRRVASEKTVYDDDLIGGVARFAEATSSEFDGLGHFRRSLSSGNFDSGNARTTYTAFNPGSGVYLDNGGAGTTYVPWSSAAPWVLGTFTETWQMEGTATARQQYCFEAATGFLQRKRVLAGAAPAATDLLTLYARDTAGNLTSEQHFGGDVQGLNTGALCSLGLPSPQYRVDYTYSRGSRATSRWIQASGAAMPFYSLQLTIDANTGLPATAWDVSGIRSDFEYDGMGRLTWEKPAAGHGAWTEYAYAKALGAVRANVTVRRRNGSKSGVILAQSQFAFDFMGRLATESQYDKGGSWRAKNTAWSSMGWKHTVSELGSSSKTEFKSYDPFGRPQTITPPTGTAHDVTLTYKGVREVVRKVRYNAANQLSTTTERYDRQGRLYQVDEPSAPSGANTTTSYAYDVGGRLKAVFMAGGGHNQGREFTYDHRGLLLHERHPEKGTSGNGYVRYLSYDALGNPGRKVDSVDFLDSQTAIAAAEIDLTFTYDRASRLTHQYAKGVLFKTFAYGTANGTGDWRLGRMWRASRYNYVWLGPSPYTVQIEETYAFGGPAGAVSSRATQSYVNGSAGDGFAQGWSYDQLGNVSTLTYPRCASAGCNGAATTSRMVGFTYANGWLASVPSYASAISYHPNGMVNTVSHANGTTYTQAADPSGMRRPSSYTVTNNGTGAVMWQSGAYAYDGSGNVTAIGGATYGYDAVSRLVSGTVATTAVAGSPYLSQSAVYDPFGNLTSLTTNNNPPLNTSTNPSTNRLIGKAYDNSGAMTSWNGNVYNREDLGLIWRYDAAGLAYVHIYTADDERLWTFHEGQNRSRWTVRDLDGKVLREFDNNAGTWKVQRDYVHRDGAPLAAILSTGHVYHFHADHLGSPRLITLNNGFGPFQLAYHAYYPYGAEATNIAQDDERMKFTGHERDLGVNWSAADDIDYMHARFYNPQLGRFLSVDPKRRAQPLARPQVWNRYSYTANRPMTYIDPDGEDLILAFDFRKSGIGINQQLKIAYATRAAFRRAGVENVHIQFGRTTHRSKGKTIRAPIRFVPSVKKAGGHVYGRTPLSTMTSFVGLGLAPTNEPARSIYLTNVAVHEVGHQAGLHVFNHDKAKAGSVMETPPSLGAVSESYLDFSDFDAKTLQRFLNDEQEEEAGMGLDSHGSVFGEKMDCARGEGGDNFCG